MNIWNTSPSNTPRRNGLKSLACDLRPFSSSHLSSQSPIFTLPLSSHSRLCWMRRMLFAGLFICQWAWHRNNYLSLWSIAWLLTRDAQDVWRAAPGPVLCCAVLCCAVLCCAVLCCAGGRGCCTACPHSTDTLTQAETHKETDMYTKHAFTLCIESPPKHTTHTHTHTQRIVFSRCYSGS